MTTHDVESGRVLTRRRRDDLLDRLTQVFLAQGFAGLTIPDLALRCHVSPGTLQVLALDHDDLCAVVLSHFFTRTGEACEARVAVVADPLRRPAEYLSAVADSLAPGSNAFFRDLERFPAGRQAYTTSTRQGADRVRELLRDAVRAGRVRDVQASFVADTVTVMTSRISAGDLLLSTGLDDARAYAELAALISEGVSS